MYIGQYNRDGSLFIAAFKDQRVRIYDTCDDYAIKKDILCNNTSWTISDTCISPDQKYLLYSTLSPDVHMVNLAGGRGIASVANVTDIHECLRFNRRRGSGGTIARGV